MAKLSSQLIRCPSVIGRDAQLALLAQAGEQVAGGQGQTLLISGEAGIGKSRLVAEARQIATRRGWRIVEGHCFEQDSILPYAPFLDLLGTLLSGLNSDEAADLFGVEARDLIKILPELGRWLPGLAPSPGLDPAQERRLAVQALQTIVARLASYQPVLVIIEDLHWSDDASLEALLHLARRIGGNTLLLVLTYRDDEVNSDLSHLLATIDRERLALELKLQRLSPMEVGAMVSAIVDGDALVRPAVRDALHALTDGNPFFIEEALNALLHEDDSGPSRGWPDHLDLDDLRVPRSVHDTVQRRVERLSPDAREILQIAAVAGRRWDFALLQELTGRDETELLDVVKELLIAQLIAEEAEDRFAFRHALTQKAVYTQLLSRERRRLHQVIAEAYERLQKDAPDRHLADLAYHAYAAEDWRRALDSALRAGEQAMALYAPQAAVEQFSRALDAAQRLSRTPAAHVYRARGRSYETLGDFDHARADYEAALSAAQAAQDQRAEWQALLDLGLLWAARDYDQSEEYCQRALALARTIADPVLLAHSLNRVGNWHTNLACPADGFAMHHEALSIVEASEDRAVIAETLDLLGIACYVAGNTCESAGYYMAAIEQFRALDDRQGVSWCLSVLALTGGTYQSDAGATPPITLDECERHVRQATDLAREIGWRPGEAFAQHVHGLVNAARGQFDLAFDLMGRGLMLSQEIGHDQWTIAGMSGFAALYLDLLDPRQSRSYAVRAVDDSRAMRSRLWLLTTSAVLASACLHDRDPDVAQAVLDAADLLEISQACQGGRSCWLVFAELCLARGDAAEALRIIDELMATDPHLTSQHDAPRLARLRGEALTNLGRLDEAEIALRAAIDGAVALGRSPLVWRAQLALGRALRARRRQADADAAFAAARETTDRLAATVSNPEIRQRFLTNVSALLPRSRPLTPRQAAMLAHGGLTARECDVAILIARGLSNRAIAEQLFVSEPTVATHVSHVLSKLGFGSRTQVAAWAIETGLLSDR